MDSIIGQDAAVAGLEAALASLRVPHAFLFAGPEGVGKHLAAVEVAKALLCGKGPKKSCGKCPSCRRVEAETHADLYALTVPEGRSTIAIDEVRELARRLAQSPFEGARKVAVVDPADAMTVEAQNSILKTLEEPPADTTIILVAENTDALLPTVRSRCRRVTFVRQSDEKVKDFLAGRGIEADTAEVLARAAQGSFAAALRLSEGALAEARTTLLPAILAARPGDEEEIAESIAYAGEGGRRTLAERREDAITLLGALHSAVVDALRAKQGAPVRTNEDLAENIRGFAASADFDTLAELEKEVSDAIIVIDAYADVRLAAMRVASALSRRRRPPAEAEAPAGTAEDPHARAGGPQRTAGRPSKLKPR